MTGKVADLLLSDGLVVTMNALGEIIPQGAVVIQGQDIVAVGPAEAIRSEWQAAEVVDCRGMVILPGLVNAHSHAPMSLLRGLADDLRLDVWLFGYMLPVEANLSVRLFAAGGHGSRARKWSAPGSLALPTCTIMNTRLPRPRHKSACGPCAPRRS